MWGDVCRLNNFLVLLCAEVVMWQMLETSEFISQSCMFSISLWCPVLILWNQLQHAILTTYPLYVARDNTRHSRRQWTVWSVCGCMSLLIVVYLHSLADSCSWSISMSVLHFGIEVQFGMWLVLCSLLLSKYVCKSVSLCCLEWQFVLCTCVSGSAIPRHLSCAGYMYVLFWYTKAFIMCWVHVCLVLLSQVVYKTIYFEFQYFHLFRYWNIYFTCIICTLCGT